VSDGEDQDDIVSRKPTVFRDISVTATRENEFPSAMFRGSPEQRVIS